MAADLGTSCATELARLLATASLADVGLVGEVDGRLDQGRAR